MTPKVAVGAAVSNDDGELLLIQRADSGVWLYPTGWCDVGYSAAEVVTKEVAEETGIEVEPVRLIGVLDGLRLGMSRIPLYSLLFYCRAVGGELRAHPLECTDVGWFTEAALPTPLVGYERWGEPVFAALRGEVRDVYYDTLRRPVWRSGAVTVRVERAVVADAELVAAVRRAGPAALRDRRRSPRRTTSRRS